MVPSYIQRLMLTTIDSTAKKETNASSSNKKATVTPKTTQKAVATQTTALQTPTTSKKSTATKNSKAITAHKTPAISKPAEIQESRAITVAHKTPAVSKPAEIQESAANRKTTPAEIQKSRAARKTAPAAEKRTAVVHRRPPPGFEINPDFICDPCALILEDKNHYLQHMITFHAFKCDCCLKRFLSKYMLQKHISGQLKMFPEGLTSVEPTVVETELPDPATAAPAKRFACGKCQDTFEDKDELKQHKTDAHWKYKCTMCEQVLSTPGTLEYHMRGHTGVRPFACNQCDQKFTANPVLLKHIATCHPKPPDPSPHAENSSFNVIMFHL